MELNKEKIAIWVEALRSGKFKQGENYLHTNSLDGEKFCCLGVACHIFKDDIDLQYFTPCGGCSYKFYNGENTVLPHALTEFLGLPDCNPNVLISHAYTTIAKLNDSGVSFDIIADIIENDFIAPDIHVHYLLNVLNEND